MRRQFLASSVLQHVAPLHVVQRTLTMMNAILIWGGGDFQIMPSCIVQEIYLRLGHSGILICSCQGMYEIVCDFFSSQRGSLLCVASLLLHCACVE